MPLRIGKDRRTLRARSGWALLACLLTIALMPQAWADTGSRLGAAQARLARIEQRVSAAQAEATRRQSDLLGVLGTLSSREASFQQLQQQLMQLRAQLETARNSYSATTSRLDQRAAEAYMQGPLADLNAFLSSSSMADLSDRVELVSAVQGHDAALAAQADARQQRLGTLVRAESRVLDRRAGAVTRIDTRTEILSGAFRAEQAALAALAAARREAARLVGTLTSQLTSQQLAAAVPSGGGGMSISYGQWAARFLSAIGAPESRNNLVVMVAWQSAEGTMASWNPLATTYSMPGATDFNSVGVKNYQSLEQGLQAIVGTLQATGHGYEAIVADLRSSAPSLTTGGAINASDWCHGCAGGRYVIDLMPIVAASFSSYSSR